MTPGGTNNGGPTSHAAHTPGPWSVGPSHVVKSTRPCQLESGLGRITEWVAECVGKHPQERIEANARLIAAAPELYEALRTCVRLCDKALGKPINLKGESPLDIANAALAKARGDQ